MPAKGAVALTVESTAGRADLLVVADLPLAQLLQPLASATGLGADAAAGLVAWDGLRRLDADRTLAGNGVVAGSVLRLLAGNRPPAAAPGGGRAPPEAVAGPRRPGTRGCLL